MKRRLQTMGIAIASLLILTWIVNAAICWQMASICHLPTDSWIVLGCQFYLEAPNSEVSKFWGGTVMVAFILSVYGLIKVSERWK